MLFASEQERVEYVRQVNKNTPGAYCSRVRAAKQQLKFNDKLIPDSGCCASCLMCDVDVQSFRDGTCYCWYSHEMTTLTHRCERYLYKFDRDEMERA